MTTILLFPSSPGTTPDSNSGFDWEELALCKEVDPELWFPEKGGSTREAKRICLRCEVREQCLTVALERDERFGVWGGKSERERRKMVRNKTYIDLLEL